MKKIFLLLIFCAAHFLAHAQPPCPGVFPVAPFEIIKTVIPPPTPNPDLSLPPDLPADRIIYWVHGLGGEPKNWNKAGLYSKETWKIHNFFPTYTDVGMNEAAEDLQIYMDTYGDPESQEQGITDYTVNFVIGHSQGGIVPRALDKRITEFYGEEERKFGGLVTFGSPHLGAKILNNVDPDDGNMLVPWAVEGCEDLLAGPILELEKDIIQAINEAIPWYIKFFTGGLGNETLNLEGIPEIICDGGGYTLPTILPIVFMDYHSPITDFYKVGANCGDCIDQINQFHESNTTLNRVAFYGIEEEPVLWRTVSSFTKDNPNQFPTFEADKDNTVVDAIKSLELGYISHVEEYNSAIEHLEDILSHFSWWNPPPPPLVWAIQDAIQEHQSMRDAWQEGLDWLQQANDNYKAIIGAEEVNFIGGYVCTCELYFGSNTEPTTSSTFTGLSQAECYAQETNFGTGYLDCEYELSGYLQVIDEDSDGVVIESSAKTIPHPTSNNEGLLKMPGSNHIQMRNDSNTGNAMEYIFDGLVGLFFKTDLR